jgi:hypothetical protein
MIIARPLRGAIVTAEQFGIRVRCGEISPAKTAAKNSMYSSL